MIPPPTIACPSGRGGHQASYQWTKDGWHLYRCTTCRHLWVSPLPTEQELIAFYDRGYFQGDPSKRGYADYDADKQSVKKDFIRSLEEIEQRIPNGRLLDIGAATGFFCQVAKERGWEVQGVELSDYAAGLGRARGLDIRTGTFEQHARALSGASVVTAWDVVEHLRDPFIFFQGVHALLEPGGLFMCALPQGDSLFARCLRPYWTLMAPPQHLHYFSLQSIQAALQQAGFEIVSIDWRGKDFPVGYIIHFVMGWFKIDWKWLEHVASWPWLSRISIRINPHDMMIVMARKP